MILVVDDDPNVVSALQRILEKHGHAVTTAANGLEAYEYIGDNKCACMLLDINMPRINGIELLLLMQADGIHIPTVVMAAFDDFEEDEMKQFSNVIKYLPKPFDMNEMLQIVEACVEDKG